MRVHVIAAGGAWDEERTRRETAEDSVSPSASVIVVGAVDAGILIVERLPREIRLCELCLFPSYQGRGIGRFLVSALQKEAAARCVPLRLHVLKVNPGKQFLDVSKEKRRRHSNGVLRRFRGRQASRSGSHHPRESKPQVGHTLYRSHLSMPIGRQPPTRPSPLGSRTVKDRRSLNVRFVAQWPSA